MYAIRLIAATTMVLCFCGCDPSDFSPASEASLEGNAYASQNRTSFLIFIDAFRVLEARPDTGACAQDCEESCYEFDEGDSADECYDLCGAQCGESWHFLCHSYTVGSDGDVSLNYGLGVADMRLEEGGAKLVGVAGSFDWTSDLPSAIDERIAQEDPCEP